MSMTPVSDLIVMHQMVNENKDIACTTELINFNRQPKKGGGTVTVGVASPQFDHLINQAVSGKTTHYAIMYIVNKDQFDELRKKLNTHDNNNTSKH